MSGDPEMSIGKRIGEFGILALYLALDGKELWPQQRIGALAVGMVGLLCLILLDGGLSRRAIAYVMGIAGLACVAVGALTHDETRPVRAEAIVTSPLRPGDEPTPPNGCDRPMPGFKVPLDAMKVLFGSSAEVLVAGEGRATFLVVGDCPVLSGEWTKDGLVLFAKLFDEKGRLIAELHDNTLDAVTNEHLRVDRGGSLNTLAIRTEDDEELLYVRYANPRTVVVRGRFGCNGHALVSLPALALGGGLSADPAAEADPARFGSCGGFALHVR